MDPDVPLDRAGGEPGGDRRCIKSASNIIANPNCSTAQMVVALKPLHDAAKITRVVVATYQSTLGRGQGRAWMNCSSRAATIFVGDPVGAEEVHQADRLQRDPAHRYDFLDDGFTKEEWKMVVETKKILDPKIKVVATCVRVPVFVGHSEAISLEFENGRSRRPQAQDDPARGARQSCWWISASPAAT